MEFLIEAWAVFLGVAFTISVGALYGVLATIIEGYAISILWKWFVVPVFHSPELSIVQAIGLTIIATHIRGGNWKTLQEWSKSKRKKKFTTKETVWQIVFPFLGPLLSLAFGWIVLKFF